MRRGENLICTARLSVALAAGAVLSRSLRTLPARAVFSRWAFSRSGIALVWGNAGILPLGQGLFFGLGGYALAMHLKLAALSPGDMPDFMQWNGLDALAVVVGCPSRAALFALVAAVVVPTVVAGALAWLVFHRRVGGVYFAIITQALALAATTFIISQQPYTGGFNGLTDFSSALWLSISLIRTRNSVSTGSPWHYPWHCVPRAANGFCKRISASCCARSATAKTGCAFWAMIRRPTKWSSLRLERCWRRSRGAFHAQYQALSRRP